MIKWFLISFLVLSGCATIPSELQNRRSIKLTLTDTPSEYCGRPLIGEVLGCAKINGLECEIVAKPPRSFEDRRKLETLGHELWHCFKGPKH